MHRARLEPMRAAARVFPEVLETLSWDVFPRLDGAAQQGERKAALSQWAEEYHVTAD